MNSKTIKGKTHASSLPRFRIAIRWPQHHQGMENVLERGKGGFKSCNLPRKLTSIPKSTGRQWCREPGKVQAWFRLAPSLLIPDVQRPWLRVATCRLWAPSRGSESQSWAATHSGCPGQWGTGVEGSGGCRCLLTEEKAKATDPSASPAVGSRGRRARLAGGEYGGSPGSVGLDLRS